MASADRKVYAFALALPAQQFTVGGFTLGGGPGATARVAMIEDGTSRWFAAEVEGLQGGLQLSSVSARLSAIKIGINFATGTTDTVDWAAEAITIGGAVVKPDPGRPDVRGHDRGPEGRRHPQRLGHASPRPSPAA